MKRISIMFTIPQLEALHALAKKRGLKFSELVRRIIDRYLETVKGD
jgi:hypothetical protein